MDHLQKPHKRKASTRRNMRSVQTSNYLDTYRSKKPRKTPFILAAVLLVALIGAGAVSVVGTPNTQANKASLSDGGLLSANDTAADKNATQKKLTITFAGDCTLGTDEYFDFASSFNAKYDAVDDPSYFFANVSDIFNADDLTVVNMEGTLSQQVDREDKTFAFKGKAEYASVLVEGGVEAACMANNHSHDYGEASYTDTIAALEEAGIATFGYDRIDYEEVCGIQVALIGTYELAEGAGIKDEMVSRIEEAQTNGAQIICVYIHWGIEGETVPDETQISLGHTAIDTGATLVIGSHPHVIQGYEKYQGRYIVYSLGNFCFGGNSNPNDKDCMIFQQTFTVEGGKVEQNDTISLIPCSVSSDSSINNYQPTPATGSEKDRIEAKIEASNESIAYLSAQV